MRRQLASSRVYDVLFQRAFRISGRYEVFGELPTSTGVFATETILRYRVAKCRPRRRGLVSVVETERIKEADVHMRETLDESIAHAFEGSRLKEASRRLERISPRKGHV